VKYFIAKGKWSITGGWGTWQGGVRSAFQPASGTMVLGIGKRFRDNSLGTRKERGEVVKVEVGKSTHPLVPPSFYSPL